MKELTKIKDRLSIEAGYKNFDDVVNSKNLFTALTITDLAAIEYAKAEYERGEEAGLNQCW